MYDYVFILISLSLNVVSEQWGGDVSVELFTVPLPVHTDVTLNAISNEYYLYSLYVINHRMSKYV